MRIELTTRKVVTFAIAILISGAAAGALFGTPTVSDDERRVVQRASQIATELLEWLPEEEKPSDIVYKGISGMLEVLDPHSNFLDPKTYRKMRERQEGSFFGVGIIISRRDGKVTVIAPMPGTPAAGKGLRAGDIIAAVDGVETEDITLDEVVDHVRGPEGSPVVLLIRRPGLQDPFDVKILRARIPTTSVRFAFMIQPEVGYIRLGEFSNTSVREVREAVDQLRDEGMKSLIFDLRNNPGGPLDAAVGISDLFLRKDQLIVSTRGRTDGSVSTLSAPGYQGRFNGPLVILVNTGSASASEIVAGAVQDHDRGLVVGETTWGKGLVQTVFGVRDGGLALTTARYYTPSGRCIQRDYESFIDYITHRNGDEDPSGREVYESDAGRTVLGGGGINPDVTISNRELAESLVRMYGSSAFFRFAVELLKDIPEADQGGFAETFDPSGSGLETFLSWVETDEILSEEVLEEFKTDSQAMADAGRALKIELLNATVGLEAGYREAIDADDQFRGALEHLVDAEDLWEAWPKEEES
ncbi:MAG: S41 family peptidase [Thermoanaerobaculales bacterium]|nr:S41 family peptidase [Thermoanaerobaculales bacterium]